MNDLRLGIVGLDMSHSVAFTELINNSGSEYHVPGGKVVAGFPGGSEKMSMSRDRLQGFTNTLRDHYGVEILDSIESVAERVDAVFLLSVDARQHLDQFRILAPYQKPVFIDKPLATSTSDACEILELASSTGAPVFSCSAIRYSPGVGDLGEGTTEHDEVKGCHVHGPMPVLSDFPRYFWYGVHLADVLVSKMGVGCRHVSVVSTEVSDSVTGVWDDGRIGTLHGYRIPEMSIFGSTIVTSTGIHHGQVLGDRPFYAATLKRAMEFFRTGRHPFDPSQMIEVIAILEAVSKSFQLGEPVAVRRP